MANWSTFISIDELGHPPATIRGCVQLASTFNREAALNILGMYNLSISLASMKGS